MIITIKTALAPLISMLPIIGAGVVGEPEEGQPVKVSTAGIVSRLLELGILGSIFLYATVQVMHTKMENIEEDINKLEITVKEHNDGCAIYKAKVQQILEELQDRDLEHKYEHLIESPREKE